MKPLAGGVLGGHGLLLNLSSPGTACEALTFDGMERWRCTRPASVDRDGQRASRQHAVLERVAWIAG